MRLASWLTANCQGRRWERIFSAATGRAELGLVRNSQEPGFTAPPPLSKYLTTLKKYFFCILVSHMLNNVMIELVLITW